jgi:cytochrome c biogenesis protein CcmG/thiol:disulfide interchange protein DsbE
LIDYDGRVSIDFGVYAAPETFLVDPSGTIVFKHLGQLTWEIVETEILPRLANTESGS